MSGMANVMKWNKAVQMMNTNVLLKNKTLNLKNFELIWPLLCWDTNISLKLGKRIDAPVGLAHCIIRSTWVAAIIWKLVWKQITYLVIQEVNFVKFSDWNTIIATKLSSNMKTASTELCSNRDIRRLFKSKLLKSISLHEIGPLKEYLHRAGKFNSTIRSFFYC
jgi:hypothetical protein